MLAALWSPAAAAWPQKPRLPSVAAPQPAASPAASPATPAEPETAPDSPRASLSEFLALARQGRFAEATGYLDLAPGQADAGAELARKLQAVLDRHLALEPESFSPLPQGQENDGQPPGVEQIGMIPSEGRNEPVRLVRRELPAGGRWLFSRNTIARIDTWYGELDDRWIRAYLPERLLRYGPKQKLMLWQWVALPVMFALSWYVGVLLSYLTRAGLRPITARVSWSRDGRLLRGLGTPLALGWSVATVILLMPYLGLSVGGRDFVLTLLAAVATAALFGALFQVVDYLGVGAKGSQRYRSNPAALSALELAVQFGKALVIAFGVVAVLLNLGYPVASVLAGIGIGGLGLALAAQKTVENLFGSVSMAVDEALRVGDVIRIDERTTGQVEAIGLRSTRIRTPDRTLVSFPNGVLATMRIESFTARDRVRLSFVLALAYGTRATQMRDVIARIEKLLRAHPRIWANDMTVAFKGFSPYSLDLEVSAWFDATWDEYKNAMRSELLLQIMEEVEAAGCAFAVPPLNPPTAATAGEPG